MDKSVLIQYCDMQKETRDIRQRIESLSEKISRIEHGETVKDTVKGGMGGIQHFVIEGVPTPEYWQYKRQIVKLNAKLALSEIDLLEKQNEAEEYIESLEDSVARAAHRMYYFDRLSQEEIAERLHYSQKTISNRLAV